MVGNKNSGRPRRFKNAVRIGAWVPVEFDQALDLLVRDSGLGKGEYIYELLQAAIKMRAILHGSHLRSLRNIERQLEAIQDVLSSDAAEALIKGDNAPDLEPEIASIRDEMRDTLERIGNARPHIPSDAYR